MSRRAVAWLVTLPLALAGTEVAHALAYGAAVPGDGVHGYLAHLPLASGLALAALVIGLAGAARGAVRVSARPFVLVALLAFVLQEYVERVVHETALPWMLVLDPVCVAGFVLVLPFALLAFGAAVALLHVAIAVMNVDAQQRLARARPQARVWTAAAPLAAALNGGHRGRAPPRS